MQIPKIICEIPQSEKIRGSDNVLNEIQMPQFYNGSMPQRADLLISQCAKGKEKMQIKNNL